MRGCAWVCASERLVLDQMILQSCSELKFSVEREHEIRGVGRERALL